MSLPNQIGQRGCQTPTGWRRLYRLVQIEPDRKKGTHEETNRRRN